MVFHSARYDVVGYDPAGYGKHSSGTSLYARTILDAVQYCTLAPDYAQRIANRHRQGRSHSI
jgi:hypothetical protein